MSFLRPLLRRRNAFRNSSVKRVHERRRRLLEPLEDRRLLATLNLLENGNLIYAGGSEANALEVSFASGEYTFHDTSGTTITPIGVPGFASLDTSGAANTVTFNAAAADALLAGGALVQITLDGRGGDDVYTLLGLRGGSGEGIDIRDTAGEGTDTINIVGDLGSSASRLGNAVTLRGEAIDVAGNIFAENAAITVGDKSAVRLGREFAAVTITDSVTLDAGNATVQINSSSTTGADVDLTVHGAGVQTRGDLTLSGASNISLNATATLLIGDPLVNKTLLSSGTGDITLAGASSTNVNDTITTGGALSITSPRTSLGNSAGTITGASVSVSGTLNNTSPNPVDIDATAGDVFIGSTLSSTTPVSVDAIGTVDLDGGLVASDIQVSGTSVTAITLQASDGDVIVTGPATFDGTDHVLVKSTNDIIFTSDITGNGRNLTLRAVRFIGVGGEVFNVSVFTTVAETVVIGDITPPPATPEITVRSDGDNVPDGSLFTLPTLTVGESGSHSVVVHNDGTADLILQPIVVTGSAFTVTSNFAPNTVVPEGGQATFTLNVDTTNIGNFGGTLSMDTNDGDENPFDLTLAATVAQAPPPSNLIDDGDAGFALTGNWSNVVGYGHEADAKAITSNRPGTAAWTFTGLEPGAFEVSTTWLNGGDRWDAVPYVIRDGVGGPILETVVVNQKTAPSGEVIGGRPFSSLGTLTVTGNTLVVEISNAGSTGAVIADAVRIESFTPPPDTPEITVRHDGSNLIDGTSFNLPTVAVGEDGSQTIVVRNDGTADLVLQPVSVTGAVFSVSSNFAPNTIVPAGGQATFELDVNTASAGTFSGTLTMENTDGDENPFDLTLAATVRDPSAPSILIDDGAPGFELTGTWNNVAGYGHEGDAKAITANRAGTATWTFTDLTSGDYKLSTTWLNGGDRWDAVPYVIRDGVGGPILATIPVNQKVAPVGEPIGGRPFSSLGMVTITGSALVVEVSNAGAAGAVIADAVRIEASIPAPNSPEIDVTQGTATVLDNGSFSFGSAEQGDPAISKTFTVTNTGTADLTLEPLAVSGAGFTLTSANFAPGQVLQPTESVDFTIELSTSIVGSFSGNVVFDNNDGDENPFDFALTGTINVAQPVGIEIIDNGDSGFSTTGNWAFVACYGYGKDALAGSGINGVETAQWVFDGLAPGTTHEVSTTWLRGSDRDDAVTYVIRDGIGGAVLSTIVVDQTQNPTGGVIEDRRPFQVLDTVTLSGSQLVVELSTAGTTKAVIADAVRIALQ